MLVRYAASVHSHTACCASFSYTDMVRQAYFEDIGLWDDCEVSFSVATTL